MTVDPHLHRSHGIDPMKLKIVAVKSPNGSREAYEPFAAEIMLVAPRRALPGQPARPTGG